MPLDKLIKELENRKLNELNEEGLKRNSWYYVSLGLALVMVIFVLLYCCKRRFKALNNCLPNCLRRGLTGVHKETVRPSYELPVMENDGIPPSTGSVPPEKIETEPVRTLRERLYPCSATHEDGVADVYAMHHKNSGYETTHM